MSYYTVLNWQPCMCFELYLLLKATFHTNVKETTHLMEWDGLKCYSGKALHVASLNEKNMCLNIWLSNQWEYWASLLFGRVEVLVSYHRGRDRTIPPLPTGSWLFMLCIRVWKVLDHHDLEFCCEPFPVTCGLAMLYGVMWREGLSKHFRPN